jgi:hypothetical protein
MNRIAKAIALLLTAACAATGCAVEEDETESAKGAVVSIPQSPVKDKKFIGFCWAYATTDFLESEFIKANQGRSLDLSEEALGFFRIAEQLHEMVREAASAEAVVAEVSCERLQGLTVLAREGSSSRGGLDLAEVYGVIPEDVYSVKFVTDQDRTETFLGMKERLAALVSEKPLGAITIDDIMDKVIVRPEGSATRPSRYRSRPPERFEHAGRTFTSAKDFYASYVRGAGTPLVRVPLTKRTDYPKFAWLVKHALAMHVSVPFGFGVDRNHLFDGDGYVTFTGKKSHGMADAYGPKADPLKGPECSPKIMSEYAQGAHAVLITDFVNEGGSEGALPDIAAVEREVSRPANELAYVLVKNNWGVDTAGAEGETSWLPSPDGYYRVDREYVQNSLAADVAMNIVVPKAVYEALPRELR